MNYNQQINVELTQKIIEDMQNAVMPWECPFDRSAMLPRNPSSDGIYSGVNFFLLYLEARDRGHVLNQWLTFNQVKEMGGSVEKGAKSSKVVFYKKVSKDDPASPTGKVEFSVAKSYRVFNVAQTSLKAKILKEVIHIPLSQVEKNASKLLIASGAKVVEGADAACYSPSDDTIYLPSREKFFGSRSEFQKGFYQTAVHELAHWSGHASRLNREFGGSFGDESYAMEELVAELTAAMLAAHLGFQYTKKSSQYLSSWIKVLKEHPQAFAQACGLASRACKYLLEKVESLKGENVA